MDGILVIDKPAGITSHDVVARVRGILQTKRVGHTGTLDPFATGVMVVLVGKATRLAQFLDKDEKEYEAVVKFGFETDTGDATGLPTSNRGFRNEEIEERLSCTDWDELLNRFRGEIEQVPPMFSAKKVDGIKLYELARKGIEIERKSVKINIAALELLSDPRIRNLQSAIRIRVSCSAGTYIRTLARDIGRAIGMGAHLTELRRTGAGKFRIENSATLDKFGQHARPDSFLLPTRKAVKHLPIFTLKEDRVDKTKCGMSTRVFGFSWPPEQAMQMIDAEGELIAIGYFDETESALKPKLVFA